MSGADFEALIKECRTLFSGVVALDRRAEAQAAVGANEKIAELVATGVKKIEVNNGQTSLTITFGNEKTATFTVSDVCKAWFNYGALYEGKKDPVMKAIWEQKAETEAKLKKKLEGVPQDQKLRALGYER